MAETICFRLARHSLPFLLRTVRIPSNRAFDTPPKRIYGGFWMNCLLCADDIALIGTVSIISRLLKSVEFCFKILGYRLKVLKWIVINPLSLHSGHHSQLCESVILTDDSFY
ncbi:hypothetical protein K501DRAFT_277920 [Backusella circina FSU 941]|nr:hypothetical protein K501DRAFT_277920 [Backusella circina FSU 941]